jgi:hypothetical protein
MNLVGKEVMEVIVVVLMVYQVVAVSTAMENSTRLVTPVAGGVLHGMI